LTLPTYLKDDRVTLEAVSRRDAQALVVADSTVLCRVLGRYLLYGEALDLDIVPHLCFDGYWESWVTVALARAIRPGFRCVDVGANHGYFTLLMADAVGPNGAVLSVEPNPRLVRYIQMSLAANGFDDRTTVEQKALWDVDRAELELSFFRNRSGGGTVTAAAAAEHEVVHVETATLDSLTDEWQSADLVKIDAEDAEPAIWRGMQQLVERSPSLIVVMEFNPFRQKCPNALLGSLTDAGFVLRYIDHNGEVAPTTEDGLLSRGMEDVMLFLARSEAWPVP
jgi:FkbM family methyltransferase